MKKLYLAIFAALCCAVLAMPTYADIAVDPVSRALQTGTWVYVLIGIAVIAAGLVLYLVLRNRKK